MKAPARFYVTTPIYYVNDRPHIGHAYTTILADTMARYQAMFGAETFFLTGTDEHGQKVQQAATKRGISPQDHVDELQEAFRSLWPELNVAHDDFIRTTELRHVQVVQEALRRLHAKGDIYAKDYTGWYSTAAERFWTEKDLVDGKCPDTGQPVQRITERNYFFRMSRYADALRAHIEDNRDFIRPVHRANEVLGFLDKGLEDLCISRPKTRLSWGIELPFDTDYVVYVWVDALTNYISALGGFEATERLETWWPSAHHIIGKDILTTHAVYWCTMLLALELTLPKSIIAHGWWLASGDTKMSKSLGNVVSPLGLKDIYGPDVFRYVLMRDMVIGLDARFDEAQLVRRNNSDLANDLGNLARRAAGLISRWFDGRVPSAPLTMSALDETVRAQAERTRDAMPGFIERLELHLALEEVMQFVRRLNKYMTETEPYRKVKTDREAAAGSLYVVLEGLRFAATLLSPVMPVKMRELLTGIGASPEPGRLEQLTWGELKADQALQLEKALFPRRDLPVRQPDTTEEAKPKQVSKAPKPSEHDDLQVIDFNAFTAVDLRIATVLSAEKVEGSDRLLVLQVDLGEERRQVVSGIAQHIAPESLPGTQVVMVANLAPRTIFKLKSQGMLLTAEGADGALELIGPKGPATSGCRVQ